MSVSLSTFTDVSLIDSSASSGTVVLPRAGGIRYRVVVFKDRKGTFQTNPLTLNTLPGDTFEDGTTTKVFRDRFTQVWLYSDGATVWHILSGTQLAAMTVSSITVSSIRGDGSLLTNLNAISSLTLQSTIQGLGTLGYVSTASLLGLVSTSFLNTSLASTVQGLGTASYVSSLSLVSTTAGLQTQFLTAGFLSTPNLTSTVAGLGSANYISTASLVSTTAALQAAGFLSTPNLLSTVAGLGSANYISSLQLLSTTASYARAFQTLSSSVSSLTASNAYASTLTVDNLIIGNGLGWINIGPLQATAISTIQLNTNALYANSNYFGTTSSQTALQFYGLTGSFSNTVIAEQSTGTGTQELLLYKVSSTSDRIRMQTTGSIVFEPGVSARIWPSAPSNLTPAMIIDTASNVGIGTGTPGSLLDVAGQGRFQLVSTLGLWTSSINGSAPLNPGQLASTVAGLGTVSYVSTASLISTTAGIQFQFQTAGFLSTATLTSTVAGLGTAGYASTSFVGNAISTFSTAIGAAALPPTAFTSTVAGLGTVGYISSSQLLSTTAGIQFQFQTAGFLSSPNLVSTTQGLNTLLATSFSSFSTALAAPLYFPSLQSTVAGLGSASYISTATLFSTTTGIYNYVSTFIDPVELTSTIIGLGSASFVSSIGLQTRLQSTVEGLGSAGYASTTFVGNAISTFSTAIGASALPPTAFTSTVAGLGSAGYVSSLSLISTTAGLRRETVSSIQGLGTLGYLSSINVPFLSSFTLSTGRMNTSTLTFVDINTQAQQVLLVSSGVLTLNGNSVAGTGVGGSGLTISDYVVAGKLAADQSLTADTDNNIQFIDDYDPQNWYNAGTYFLTPTIAGYYLVNYQVWFNAGAVSTNQWNIQIQKNSSETYAITQLAQVTYTGVAANTSKIIYMNGSSDNLRFRAYVGSSSNTSAKALQGTATGGSGTFFTAALLTNGSGGGNLVSTTVGLGSIGYVSTLSLISTTAGIQYQFQTAGFVSSPNLLNHVSTQGLSTVLYSTIASLGSFGYISSSQLVSTTAGLQIQFQTAGFLSTANLTSTVAGLGSAGYASTSFVGNAISTFSTAIGASALPPTAFTSTVAGLGSAGYISSSQLVSTTQGLQIQFQTAGFLSTPNLISTVAGLGSAGYASTSFVGNAISTFSTAIGGSALPPTAFTSTVAGLGSAGYISTASLISTTTGIQIQFQTAGFLSTANLTSTVAGLGSATYISSSQLVSTVAGLTVAPSGFPSTVSTAYGTSFTTLSLTATLLSSQQIQTSSIIGNQSIFQTLSSQALTVSSFFTATRQMTPMFIVF